MGLASEAAVRAAGAVPATIGVLDGQIVVGLDRGRARAIHAGRRASSGRATSRSAPSRERSVRRRSAARSPPPQAVGIRFMGTGGLGGVHRGFPTPPDVSADLGACARIPALIASSGVKSLLDVGRRWSCSRRSGVPVLGYRHRHAAALLRRGRRPAGLGPRRRRGRGRAHRRRALAARRATRSSSAARRPRASTCADLIEEVVAESPSGVSSARP